ncbi:hypothetical protein [Candidatus Mycoplasma haematohominis]|uniref:Uncharacterized protein n=1 Tax=Candidatus Mycoplasma haematohominis TaxID=1494318 RepID=A0A478FP55_9MOLU|nr:hypothetical protein [Candidatus Mycoplasma haemohominis]GCE63063.1 hypothetical protein MHSWG343_00410 [Candidatus Mycoplasma haemohominis]
MASPAAIGTGVIGGTAAVGATSFATYQALNKGGTPEQIKEPDKKVEDDSKTKDKPTDSPTGGETTDETAAPKGDITPTEDSTNLQSQQQLDKGQRNSGGGEKSTLEAASTGTKSDVDQSGTSVNPSK